jgi:hypothetical protein
MRSDAPALNVTETMPQEAAFVIVAYLVVGKSRKVRRLK